MSPLTLVVKIGLYALMLGSLAAAVGAVAFRNIFHSALSLVAVLLGIAGLYLALHAEFIAIVQVLLYVGAVMTLLIYAIMLTHRIGDQTIPQTNQQSLPALLGLVAFVALIGSLILKTNWSTLVEAGFKPASTVDTLALGKALLGEYVFPFEVISVVLIAALIGAVVIARKD